MREERTVYCSDGIYYWNKYILLGKLVNNNQDYIKAK